MFITVKSVVLLGFFALGAVACAEENVLISRDAAYKHGVIEYHFSDSKTSASPMNYDGKLFFSSDGRMLDRLVAPQNFGPNVEYVTFVQGKGWRYTEISQKKKVVVTFNDAQIWYRNDEIMTFLQPVPCGPLGLGFRNATSTSSTTEGAETILKGAINDGLTFDLRLNSNGVPTKLDYINGDQIFGTWTYTGSINASDNLRLPQRAEFRAPWLGAKGDRNWAIKSANLRIEPKPSDLITNWFRPGVEIVTIEFLRG